MSRSSIEFEYNQAIAQARRLETIADGMSSISDSDIENVLGNLAMGWQGEASEMFAKKGIKLSKDVKKTASDLENAAQSIKRIAKKIHDAEMVALAIAQKRNY